MLGRLEPHVRSLPDSVSDPLIGQYIVMVASDWLNVEHLLSVSWEKTGLNASLLNLSTLVRLISSDITQRSLFIFIR